MTKNLILLLFIIAVVSAAFACNATVVTPSRSTSSSQKSGALMGKSAPTLLLPNTDSTQSASTSQDQTLCLGTIDEESTADYTPEGGTP